MEILGNLLYLEINKSFRHIIRECTHFWLVLCRYWKYWVLNKISESIFYTWIIFKDFQVEWINYWFCFESDMSCTIETCQMPTWFFNKKFQSILSLVFDINIFNRIIIRLHHWNFTNCQNRKFNSNQSISIEPTSNRNRNSDIFFFCLLNL